VLVEAHDRGRPAAGPGRHHAGRPKVHGAAIGYSACSRDQLTAAIPDLLRILATHIQPS